MEIALSTVPDNSSAVILILAVALLVIIGGSALILSWGRWMRRHPDQGKRRVRTISFRGWVVLSVAEIAAVIAVVVTRSTIAIDVLVGSFLVGYIAMLAMFRSA